MGLTRYAKDTAFRLANRKCSIKDTIVVAGSPRSGTTWLLELLRSLPGYKAMNEPLMHEEARSEHGFSWRTHLHPRASAPKQHDYLKAILTGRLGISPAWHFKASTRAAQLVEHATHRKLVVKFCRFNRMLHWFAGQFDVRGPVFIIRHPCAVVASMLRHGGWEEEHLQGEQAREYVEPAERLPAPLCEIFDPIFKRIRTRTEALATLWCLDHYIPLMYHAGGTYPWILVPYERLVTRGSEELRRVTDALGVEMTPAMHSQLRAPSSSVRDQLHQETEQQLSKWRRRLTNRQVDDILRIVDEVGLSPIYTEALEPGYNRLNELQQPEWVW